jgi:hypothetical protein
MSPSEFCYWLQGFFELGGSTVLSREQVEMIKAHLGYVFEHKAVSSNTPETTSSTTRTPVELGHMLSRMMAEHPEGIRRRC